jgi:hypothetical protein
MRANGLLHDQDLERIEAQVAREVESSVAFAEAGQWEPLEQLGLFVVMDRVPS